MYALELKRDSYSEHVSMQSVKSRTSSTPSSHDKELENWVKFAIKASKDFDYSGPLSGREGHHAF